MDVSEVKDGDSLERYFEALTDKDRRDVVLRVAFNNAARVLPIAADLFLTSDWARKRDLTPVAVFGSLSLSAVGRKMVISARAAHAAAAAAHAHAQAARAAVARAAATTAAAAASATTAAAAAAYTAHAASTRAAAARAVAGNANTYAGSMDLWNLIRRDLTEDAGVWPDGMPDVMGPSWRNARAAMESHAADWSIWILWYNRILDGRDWHPQAMWKVLLKITKEDWEKGPEHINPMFDEVLALYLEDDVDQNLEKDIDQIIEATPIGADVVYDDVQDLLVLQQTDQVDDRYLREVVDQLREAFDLIDPDKVTSNALITLRAEAEIIAQALERYSDRPVQLLKFANRVQTRLETKIKANDCPNPEEDADINDLKSILTSVQFDLIALSPEVREYHEATKPEVPEDVVPVLIEGARDIALASDPELARLLDDEREVLEDHSLDRNSIRNAGYFVAGIVMRTYRVIRKLTTGGSGLVKEVMILAGAGNLAWNNFPAFRALLEPIIRWLNLGL